MYVAAFDGENVGADPVALFLFKYKFIAAAYLIFLAMLFDGLDGRLARFARHTTDFGGQLDSLADVISFGAAPAFLGLLVFKACGPVVPFMVSRLVWAIGALFLSCALLRLARFNVSNEHGEQHHFSFLGLPSPAAAGTVASLVLMQQDLRQAAIDAGGSGIFALLAPVAAWSVPPVVLGTGLLMVSNVRYPHVVNQYLRGRRSIDRLLLVVAMLLLAIVAHRYALGVCMLVYVIGGLLSHGWGRFARQKTSAAGASPATPSQG
jgi:CDP-diacylglycerol--serine O-phosphatidyltransferase